MSEFFGLLADVYRTDFDATNGGLSRRDGTNKVVVFGTEEVPMEGYIRRDEYAYPEVELKRTPYGDVKAVARRTPMQEGYECGPMMGGNYISSSDGRFRRAVGFYGAVPLHDRYETLDQNRALSI